MTRKISFLAGALFVAAVPAIRAQSASVLGAGTRVKLTTPALDATQQTGTVVEATKDTITFRSDAYPVTRSFAVSDLSAIEISAGMATHRGEDAIYGLVIGSLAGGMLAAATYKKTAPCEFFCPTRGGSTAGGAIMGGLVGTLVGAYVVGSFHRTERWIPLRKTASIRVVPGTSGISLAMNARF